MRSTRVQGGSFVFLYIFFIKKNELNLETIFFNINRVSSTIWQYYLLGEGFILGGILGGLDIKRAQSCVMGCVASAALGV